ncbi:MAG: putative 4-hydroxybenzoate polyprenyltransferase [Planctomycetia bacterium]|nr:putative 4-hydroxybenzoate polyprenyltransferase [Planctomycetia bacterium]
MPSPPKGQGSSLFARFKLFLELIRFSHTIFALPFALLAAAMALSIRREYWKWETYLADSHNQSPHEATESGLPFLKIDGLDMGPLPQPLPWFRWQELVGILLCMVFARSAAMAFNRLVDAKFDAENPRTKMRHIPAGLLSSSTVALYTIVCSVGFIASTALFLPNRWPLMLSVPVLLFLCGYSLTKRFTSLAHFWLGASLMLAPVAAWIAILGDAAFDFSTGMPYPPLILGGAVLLWVAGFDMIYATQDFDVDRKLRLRSIPAKLGVRGALRLAAVCHLGMVVLLFVLPSFFGPFGGIWYAGAAATAALLIYEHALVKPDDLTRVNAAFFTCNAVVSLGLLAVGLLDLLI